MAKQRKFDKSICECCQLYWGYLKSCHAYGKHIYDGECLAYKPTDDISEADRDAIRYDKFQEEWN